MKISLDYCKDEWGRNKLLTSFHTDSPSLVLTFITFNDELWWAKSSNSLQEHVYSAFYHHVYENKKRQVMVFCDNHMIQHCVIPKGFDPTSNTDATFDELVPSTIYANGPHTLGLIVLPKEVVKKMRNGIWRLKDEFYNNKLSLFKDALSHGRVGYTKSSNTGVPL